MEVNIFLEIKKNVKIILFHLDFRYPGCNWFHPGPGRSYKSR